MGSLKLAISLHRLAEAANIATPYHITLAMPYTHSQLLKIIRLHRPL